VRARWSVTRVIIQHKLGSCPIGEVSVLIAISSEHRRESLEAVAFAIDDLKANVPIWKKVRAAGLLQHLLIFNIWCVQERYETGSATWKENKEFVVSNSNV
jgi:hypothetical protein